jgi:hypothetical protein
MSRRLSQRELHELFLTDLAPFVEKIDDNGKKPLVISLTKPFCCTIKAYIFNCTCPPGGRVIDEYKVQLILDGQQRGQRGCFDDSDGLITMIVGYADPLDEINNGVWVLFETEKHREFAYSANIQIYLRQILQTLSENVVVHVKHNKETVVLSQRQHLPSAVMKRLDVDLHLLLEDGDAHAE